MHENITNYDTIMAQSIHWFESKLEITGESNTTITIGEDKLLSLSQEQGLFSSNEFALGGCVSAELDAEFMMPSATIPQMAKCSPYVRAVAKVNGSLLYSDWIKKGVFFIDTREVSNSAAMGEVMKIHAYDTMLKTETPNLTVNDTRINQYPKTMPNVIKDICTDIGVSYVTNRGNSTQQALTGTTIKWNQNFNYTGWWNLTGTLIPGTIGTTSVYYKDFAMDCVAPVQGHKYAVIWQVSGLPSTDNCRLAIFYGTGIAYYGNTNSTYVWLYPPSGTWGGYNKVEVMADAELTININAKMNILDLTVMFGAGNEPATRAELRAIFPVADVTFYEKCYSTAKPYESMPYYPDIAPFFVQMTGVGNNAYTKREVLSYIAAANGGCFIMNDDGNLQLIRPCDIDTSSAVLINKAGKAITFGGVKIKIG